MKVAIIGAGFAGLSAGYYLSKRGIEVTIFETEDRPGGLAAGFKKDNWDWPLEYHYKHWFVSDRHIRNLAEEINHPVTFTRPKTSTYINGEVLQLDSPMSLLSFTYLSVADRIRTGAVLAYLKLTPFWKLLESTTSEAFLKKTMGKTTWEVLWKPLFKGKFATSSRKIPASWFWARIKKRSTSLGYPEGGFERFAETIAEQIQKMGGKFYYETSVKKIKKKGRKFEISYQSLKSRAATKKFGKVISTLPFPVFLRIATGLPGGFTKTLAGLEGIGAVNLILRLKKQFLKGNTYWLNINEPGFPFLAIVEHTNFISKKHYNNEHLVYVGKYLPTIHQYFSMSDKELLKTYSPYLKKINPGYEKTLIGFNVFKAPLAQPIIPLDYSSKLPPINTSVEGLFLATIQQVYPWDRGTNYAVELGRKVAEMIIHEKD